MYLFGAGLLLLLVATVATEHTQRWGMHQAHFYQVSAAVFLFFIISAARASVARWPATTIVLVYTVLTLIMLVLMPLFPAQPLLGPIYVQVDRFMPTDFPLLLIVPALALDLVMQRTRGRVNDWTFAALASAVFVAAFLAAQWPFADFLMSAVRRGTGSSSAIGCRIRVDPAFQSRWYLLNPPDNLAAGLSDRAGAWIRLGPLRSVVGQLDGAGSAVSRWRAHGAVLALAVLSMAHVGSPDTFFGGRAGPYNVRVSVRLPGVIPGRAQVAVRVAGATRPQDYRVTVRAGQWNVGLKGAPPPEPAPPGSRGSRTLMRPNSGS